ncbi:MAG: GDP-L-fucose synthase [Acidobacteriota bacterium]|nr:GDP-L-fucose synthase [Acidobacteriota bacterium]
MELDAKIFVAGHRGMVGSAVVRRLEAEGYHNLILRTSSELDLRNQSAVRDFFDQARPDYIFLAAAKVGGIMANKTYKADFLYDNLMIQTNIIDQAMRSRVKKLLFLGSSCIYPKMSPQPIREDYLLTGPLEPTNDAYAVAKIAGIKMCQAYREQHGCNFIAAMPTNLYGPNDNYDPQNSHVLPALLRKFHLAKVQNLDSVEIWGTGSPKREFLHVDDLADACLFMMRNYDGADWLNVGTGQDCSIRELAETIQQTVGFRGKLTFDRSKPDGTPRKLLDVSRLAELGWRYRIGLQEGIASVYEQAVADGVLV